MCSLRLIASAALMLGCSESAAPRDASAADVVVDVVRDVAADLPPALPHPDGRWARGDLHVHATGASNDTRGMSFPREIARVARERGLHWVVLTDHSNSTGSDPTTRAEDPSLYNRGHEFPYQDEAARLTEPGRFVMVDGNEVSPVWSLSDDAGAVEPRGHLGCIPPADLMAFRARVERFAFNDRPPGAVRGGDNVAAIHDLGAWAVLNHPHSLAGHIAYDWTSFDYDAIEVWNGTAHYDPSDEAARNSWLCDLASGRPVVMVGGSDCHEAAVAYPGPAANPAIGFPTTSVYTRDITWPAISEALRQGRVVVHSVGSFLALWMARGAGETAALPGESVNVAADQELTFELEGEAAVASSVTLWRTRAGSCMDTRRPRTSAVPTITPERVFQADVAAGPFRVLARVRAGAGVAFVHAEMHAQGAAVFERDLALTNAVRITAP